MTFFGVLGAIGSFLWGIFVWHQQARLTAETRRVEATKPFLERQLKLYTETSQILAVIATSQDLGETHGAHKRFLELYWGELALVENDDVANAMANFKKALERDAEKAELQLLSLTLAHICRKSLARSWGIDIWTIPDQVGTSRKSS